MKHTIRSATGQYEFVETEFEDGGVANEVHVRDHQTIVAHVKGEAGEGLSDKDFNGVMDVYLATREIPNGADLYAAMSSEQQRVIQCIKRSFARTKEK